MDHHAGSTGDPTVGGGQLPSETGRVWSCVATPQERNERREHANQMVGLDLAAIRYFTIDYSRWDLAREHLGPRLILDAREWQDPTWRYHDCDSVDYGIELQTSDRRVFSITWDPPGVHEGLGLREQRLLGTSLVADADMAVWDVTDHSNWASLTGRCVDDVALHYENWGKPGEGFWCPRISLQIGTRLIEFLMAEGETDRRMSPSADNVAVVFTTSNRPITSRPTAWWRR
jgi:hypothetical protein